MADGSSGRVASCVTSGGRCQGLVADRFRAGAVRTGPEVRSVVRGGSDLDELLVLVLGLGLAGRGPNVILGPVHHGLQVLGDRPQVRGSFLRTARALRG